MKITVSPVHVAEVIIDSNDAEIIKQGIEILNLCASIGNLANREIKRAKFGDVVDNFIITVESGGTPSISGFPD